MPYEDGITLSGNYRSWARTGEWWKPFNSSFLSWRRGLWTVKPEGMNDSSHHFNNENTDSSHTQTHDCLSVIHETSSWLSDAQVHNIKTVIMGPQNVINTVVFQCTSSAVCVYTLCGRSAQYVDRCEIFNITFHIRLYLHKCIFLWE